MLILIKLRFINFNVIVFINFIKKRLQRKCSCQISEIFKNTFVYRTPPLAGSDDLDTTFSS